MRSLIILLLFSFLLSSEGQLIGWPNWGGGLNNDHNAFLEEIINPCTAKNLQLKWTLTTIGDVAAPPSVDSNGIVYVPDLGGKIWAVNGQTGRVLWSVNLSQLTGVNGVFNPVLGRTNGTAARGTPAIYNGALYFGDVNSGYFLAISTRNGSLLWKTLLDSHPAAKITMAPTVVNGLVFIGVSSDEETLAAFPGYPCCSFRGSMLALNAQTGAIVWKTYMTVPDFPGAAVWGSSPSIDLQKRAVYVATGNTYSAPPAIEACITANNGDASKCPNDPGNLEEAIVALDMYTGNVLWNISFAAQGGVDVWNIGCAPAILQILGLPPVINANCPANPGIDADFGQAPLRFFYEDGPYTVELLGVGQKNGFFFAVDPDTAKPVWVTPVSPPGESGGLLWGSAFDGERIYVASSNSAFNISLLQHGVVTSGGWWSALDPATGSILWETAVPQGINITDPGLAAEIWPLAWSSLTVANGVVFAGAGNRFPNVPSMFALDAATGEILWQYTTGSATISSPAVVNGVVYWGTGYAEMSSGGHSFYAFAPNNLLECF